MTRRWSGAPAALALCLSGCLALPPCEKPTIVAGEIDGETYAVLDAANMTRLVALLDGLRRGTCRVGGEP